ncbi:hypothetical protein CASFOL_023522 [Castilleja foliolosa]|uniref:Peptidase A1 domain-containing protein n=1 Tax=Castilleja foliolosa TaxID=1961234 RepID=A0ABD3CKT4_9LAMI
MSLTNFFSPTPMALLILFVAFVAPLIPPTIPTSMHAHYHNQSSTTENGFQSTLTPVDHGKSLTKTELLYHMVKRGKKRVQWLKSKITDGPAIPFQEASGEYLMSFSIGSPTKSPVTAIMDTGSDLIWTQCKLCNPCINQSTPIFDPKNSHSYSKLNCLTKLCKALPSNCDRNNYCNYRYGYGGNMSTTRGSLATDTFTFGEKVFPKIGFGCGLDNVGNFLNSSGIVGLGRGALSLVSQLNQPRFSYCLPTLGSGKTGTLMMGCRATNPPGVHVNTTPLIKNPYDTTSYYLSLQGITIGRTRLRIDNSTFAIRKDGSGGLVIDSGATLTYLEESAFKQVKNELKRQLVGLKTVNGSDIGLDVCFNITSRDLKRVKFPVVVFHFENGVNLELKQENYFLNIDEEGVGCLMMVATRGFSTLGNFQQQNTLVVYDLAKGTLSFLPNYKKCDKV